MKRAAAIVFVASFCTLVIELVAGRVLAPYVGVSLYTWTSIIGVVLAGISAGAYAGGWLADRRASSATLASLLFASGVTAMLIVPATTFLAADEGALTSAGLAMTLLSRVIALSVFLFFLPSFFLGMISPVAVKIAVRDLATAGSVVGKIYAFSTLGSIAGTFTTGFWLVARFGTRATLVGVGIVLITSALLLLGTAARVAATALIVACVVYALRPVPLAPPRQRALIEPAGRLHFEESQYYTIAVERTVGDDGTALNALHLDHLVHSYADPHDAAHLEYGYLRIFKDLIDAKQPKRLLFVGGGGYTLPRLVRQQSPSIEVDVVEIVPAVTRVARRFFAAPREVRTHNEDARWFAMRARGPYDIIFVDAFNDLSVPYHLTTREYALALQRMLAPDGVVAVNLIDDFEKGRFLGSYVRTLQSVFDDVNVILEEPDDVRSSQSTFVVMAGQARLPVLHRWSVLHPMQISQRDAIVLTDDFAPVDNMLAPLFARRFVDEVR